MNEDNLMKWLKYSLLIGSMCALLFYSAFSFGLATFNISAWPESARFWCATFALCGFFAAACLVLGAIYDP